MQSQKSASASGSLEQGLAPGEARYRALVDSSPSAIIVHRNGKVWLANPACVRLFGASSPGELLGKSVLDLFEPDCCPLVEERLLVGSETVPPIDVRVIRLDGTVRDVEATAAPFLDEGIPSVQVVLIDITERKLEEEQEAQRIAASYSRSLIEASLDPLVTISQDGTITDVNEATEKATGVPRDRLIGTDFADYFTDSDRARAGYERVLKDGFVRDYPLGLRSASGSVIDVEYNATVYRDNGGEVQGAFAAARDVTDSKKAHVEMARLAAIVTLSPDAIFSKTLTNGVTSWNAGAENLYGYSAAEMIGAGVEVLLPAGRENEAQELTERVRRGEQISGFETVRKRKDGSLVEVSLTLSPIFDDEGSIVAASVVGHDITDRKEAERARDIQGRIAYVFGTSPEEAMYEEVLQIVLDATHSPLGLFGYLDQNGDLVVPSLSREIWDQCNVPGKSMRFPHGTWGDASWVRALREKRSIDSNEPSTIVPAGHLSIRRNLAMPILFQGEVIGLFEAANRETDYTEADLRALAAIAEHVAPLLDARLRRERADEELAESAARLVRQAERIARTLTSVVDVTSSIVELRDPYTAGHQRRVSELAGSVAESLGMSGDEIGDIRVAGLLHDIGKAGIPTEILTKPGALSPIEFKLIKGHAEAGYRLAVSANMAEPIAEMIYEHHERLDGSGYPRGLTGAQTLFGAKVLAVADVVEAMMSHRPYRPALGIKAALAEIKRGTGTRYDTLVAQTCVRLFNEEGFKFSER